jgi:O-antigen/teichoic acid export membrane protein
MPETAAIAIPTAPALIPVPAANPLRDRFARAAGWSIFGAVVSRSFNFAAWIICARWLGKTSFGALSMIQSTVGMLGVFAGMGLGLTATRYVAELRQNHAARAGRVLGLCCITTFSCSALMSGLILLFAPQLARTALLDTSLALPLALSSLLVFLNAVTGYQTGALAGFEAFRAIARVGFWAGLASFPIMAVGVRLGGLNGAVLGLAIATAFNWWLNHRALRQECAAAGVRFSIAGCAGELPIVWQFSLPALLTSVLVSPAMWLCNRWLVHGPGGYAALGLYGAADRFRLAVLFVPASIFSTVVPLLSRLRGDSDFVGFRSLMRMNLLLNVALVSVPAVMIAVLARPLLLLFGAEYREGWPILVVLAFSAIPEALNTILGQPLIATAMWRRFAFDALLVITLLLCARLLIPRWGGLGLASAYALAFTATSTALALFVRDAGGRP